MTVEVKKQDGGYVVLTFILVGSIAGVVLAVTIIYLIKRHRRSRDKLAQLAATADGNEASKDYQVWRNTCLPSLTSDIYDLFPSVSDFRIDALFVMVNLFIDKFSANLSFIFWGLFDSLVLTCPPHWPL